MNRKIDLFDSTYSNFETEVLARIRRQTFGEDFGQNSWTTAAEYRRWAEDLDIRANSRVLEVASGSGGPAIFLAGLSGARVTGIEAPPGVNERLIEAAGFELSRQDDVTENAASISGRWHDARAEDRQALLQIEGEDRYAGLQEFFAVVHRLTSERRLSRFAYLLRRR